MEQLDNIYQPTTDGAQDPQPKKTTKDKTPAPQPYDHNLNPFSEAGISMAQARGRRIGGVSMSHSATISPKEV